MFFFPNFHIIYPNKKGMFIAHLNYNFLDLPKDPPQKCSTSALYISQMVHFPFRRIKHHRKQTHTNQNNQPIRPLQYLLVASTWEMVERNSGFQFACAMLTCLRLLSGTLKRIPCTMNASDDWSPTRSYESCDWKTSLSLGRTWVSLMWEKPKNMLALFWAEGSTVGCVKLWQRLPNDVDSRSLHISQIYNQHPHNPSYIYT